MEIIHFEVSHYDEQLFKESLVGSSGTRYIPDVLNLDTVKEAMAAEVVSVFVNSVVDKSIIDSLPATKLIITRSTGFDHIDVAYAAAKGIVVCNVPAYGSRTVAEFTFALLLALSRKIVQATEQIKYKHSWSVSEFEGFNLQGRTLGIIGTGKIGINVAQIARGFDMRVVAYDVYPNAEKAKELSFSYLPLEELLSVSDIVTLHVPATKDTHHLINLQNIIHFKKGALLINTSRGDVVDLQALLIGLKEGVLSGAGLDVLEGEHELKEEAQLLTTESLAHNKLKLLLEGHMLMENPNVIITPHIAFNTTEAKREIVHTTLENISAFAAGSPLNVLKV